MSDNNEATESRAARTAPSGRPFTAMNWLVALVALIAIIAVGFVGAALKHTAKASANTISVTGTATVMGTPDTVSFQIGMQTVNVNAAEALKMNNGRVAALEAALLRNGVTKKEMQTSGLNIAANTNNMGVVTGFTVEDDLNITMHDLKKAGSAIEAAAQAGGNGVELNSINFSISNDSKLLAKARANAMRNAHTEASNIATAGGTTLTGIVKIVDQENQSSILPTPVNFSAAATAVRSVPIQAGSESLSVQVSVVYSLAN
ncbi:MAG: SIMPL domain-containing protein [Acidimicrobiales bacterium]